jgi:hypothetical protein
MLRVAGSAVSDVESVSDVSDLRVNVRTLTLSSAALLSLMAEACQGCLM